MPMTSKKLYYLVSNGFVVRTYISSVPVEHSVVWLDRIATNALDGIATNGIREYYFNYVFNGSYAHRDADAYSDYVDPAMRQVNRVVDMLP